MRKSLFLFLCTIAVAGTLSGCAETGFRLSAGNESSASISSADNAEIKEDNKEDNKEDEALSGVSVFESILGEFVSSSSVSEPEVEAEKTRFDKFMTDEEPVYFGMDIIKKLEWSTEFLSDNYFIEENTPYTISELISLLNDGLGAQTERPELKVEYISYRTVECGVEKTPALAVFFEGMELDSMAVEPLIIIMEKDDKLQAVYGINSGYRSSTNVNDEGVVSYGGSDGAGAHSCSYTLIDGEGNSVFLYSVRGMADYTWLYLGPDVHMDLYGIADEYGIADNVFIEQYSFKPYDYEAAERDYFEFIKDDMFTYYAINSNGEVSEDEGVYEEGNDYRTVFDMTGLSLSTPSEINARIKELEESYSLNPVANSFGNSMWETIDPSKAFS